MSELTPEVICNHLRELPENLSPEDVNLINAMKKAAVECAKGITGLKDEQMEEHEDITIAVLTIISDMWDNRSMTVNQANINKTADTILGLHRINLVPTPEVIE